MLRDLLYARSLATMARFYVRINKKLKTLYTVPFILCFIFSDYQNSRSMFYLRLASRWTYLNTVLPILYNIFCLIP